MSVDSACDIYDAIIIGGGPGGSAAGCTLAQAGKKVLILEREHFPRFHIGESLIPYGNEVLRELGVWEKLQPAGFMPKLGAEFVLGNSQATNQVLFGKHLPEEYAQTFQVERAKFDEILLNHAGESGCDVWQNSRVESVEMGADASSVVCLRNGAPIRLRARWILDATGRDAFLGKQLKLPKTDLGMPKKFATFAHFRGVRRNPCPTDGHITIVRLDFGWCWLIPLDAEKTSVGLVQSLEYFQKTGLKPQESFERAVESTSELRARMEGASRVGEYCFTGDYTYRYLQNAGPRWLLIGDAAGFIDPIFSSGVMLALKSGRLAAQELIAADLKHAPLSAAVQQRYTEEVGKMCTVFQRLIEMFYDNHAFEVFMTPAPLVKMEQAMNNLVGGNTNLRWWLRMHIWLFYVICSIQKRFPLLPRLDFSNKAAQPKQA